LKGSRREVETCWISTPSTPVREGNGDLIASVVNNDVQAADRVVIGVDTSVVREVVKHAESGGCDELVVVVGDTTCTKTGIIPSA